MKLYLTIGRFQGITKGHDKLLKTLDKISNHTGKCLVSKKIKKDTDILSYDEKLTFLKKGFSNIEFSGFTNIIKTLSKFNKDYDELCFVVGEDRYEDFRNVIFAFNGREYNYNNIEFVKVKRNNISASKLRLNIDNNNKEKFNKIVSKHIDKEELWNLIKTKKALAGKNSKN